MGLSESCCAGVRTFSASYDRSTDDDELFFDGLSDEEKLDEEPKMENETKGRDTSPEKEKEIERSRKESTEKEEISRENERSGMNASTKRPSVPVVRHILSEDSGVVKSADSNRRPSNAARGRFDMTPPPGLSRKSNRGGKDEKAEIRECAVREATMSGSVAMDRPSEKERTKGTRRPRGEQVRKPSRERPQTKKRDTEQKTSRTNAKPRKGGNSFEKRLRRVVLPAIYEAQKGKLEGYTSYKVSKLMLVNGKRMSSAAILYLFPGHFCHRTYRDQKLAKKMFLPSFMSFGFYLLAKGLNSHLLELTRLMETRLQGLNDKNMLKLFENVEDLDHIVESMTLFLLATAQHMRWINGLEDHERCLSWPHYQGDKASSTHTLSGYFDAFASCLESNSMMGGLLSARAVDEVAVMEGFTHFGRVRSVSQVRELLTAETIDTHHRRSSVVNVIDKLPDIPEVAPRESFVHGQFENTEEHVSPSLSAVFQTLWHSSVFHRAFEGFVVRPIQRAGDDVRVTKGTVTFALLQTWLQYERASSNNALVSPKYLTDVWGSHFVDPVDCFNKIGGMRNQKKSRTFDEPSELADMGISLFGKSVARDSVVYSYTGSTKKRRDVLDRDVMWQRLPKVYKARPLLVLHVATNPEITRNSLVRFVSSIPSTYDSTGLETKNDIGKNGHKLVAIICYISSAKHYVTFCRRRLIPSRWRLFNDRPKLLPCAERYERLISPDGGDMKMVLTCLDIYELTPSIFVFDSTALLSEGLEKRKRGGGKECVVM